MIISHSKKIIILLNPKTGTQTLAKLFTTPDVDYSCHDHSEYNELFNRDPAKNYFGYRTYCFYRNPLTRFISSFNYIRQTPGYYQTLLYYFCGDIASSISCIDNTLYENLSDDIKKMVCSVSLDRFLDSNFITDLSKTDALAFVPQTKWLQAPTNIRLLNYDDFSNGVRFLAKELDISIGNIPRINPSLRITEDALTPEQEAKIRDIYKVDYDFLKSMNISFR